MTSWHGVSVLQLATDDAAACQPERRAASSPAGSPGPGGAPATEHRGTVHHRRIRAGPFTSGVSEPAPVLSLGHPGRPAAGPGRAAEQIRV